MIKPEATIRVNVDVTNPGQVFACCGLLELAHRLDHRALGWFEKGCFHLADVPHDLLRQFLVCQAEPIVETADDGKTDADDNSEKAEGKTVPILLASPFDLRLDWWRSKEAEEAKLKTWSAGQGYRQHGDKRDPRLAAIHPGAVARRAHLP
jgi:CRISPR-associated protein Csb3